MIWNVSSTTFWHLGFLILLESDEPDMGLLMPQAWYEMLWKHGEELPLYGQPCSSMSGICLDCPRHKLRNNFVIGWSRSDLLQCLGIVFLWLTISERLTSLALGVAFPSTSLEVTLPLDGWSLRECLWLVQERFVKSRCDCPRSTESWSGLSFLLNGVFRHFPLSGIIKSDLSLLNRVLRHYVFWYDQLRWLSPAQRGPHALCSIGIIKLLSPCSLWKLPWCLMLTNG